MTELSTSFSRIFRDLPREFSARPPHFRAFSKRKSVFWGHEQFLAPLVSVGGGRRGLLNFRLERRIV
jgi:hypothetical protein